MPLKSEAASDDIPAVRMPIDASSVTAQIMAGTGWAARMWALAVVLAALTIASAHAAVLCRKKTGAVVMRDACGKKETPIDLTQFGAVGPPGEPGAPGTPGTPGPMGPGFVVKDANGAVVGTFASGGLRPTQFPFGAAIRQIGADLVLFVVSRDGFGDVAISPLCFQSVDCTGTPLLGCAPPGASSPKATVDPQALVSPVYLPYADNVNRPALGYYQIGSASTRSVGSTLYFTSQNACATAGGSFASPSTCCVPSPGSVETAEAASLDLTTLGLVPPFHVEEP